MKKEDTVITKSQETFWSKYALVLLLIPSVGYLMLFYGTPLLKAVLGSFGIGLYGDDSGFTLKYYHDIFTSKTSLMGIAMSIYFGIVPMIVSLIISIPLASLLQRSFYGRKLFNGLYKIPLAIPSIVTALMTLAVFGQGQWLSRLLFMVDMEVPQMVRDKYGIGVIIAIAWKNIPFMTIIISGGMGAISKEVINASRLLGASKLKTFFLIEIPMAMPSIVAAVLLTFISSMGAFAVPNLLGAAYPLPLSVMMYDYFQQGKWGYVFAMGLILTAFAMLILVAYYTIEKRMTQNKGE